MNTLEKPVKRTISQVLKEDVFYITAILMTLMVAQNFLQTFLMDSLSNLLNLWFCKKLTVKYLLIGVGKKLDPLDFTDKKKLTLLYTKDLLERASALGYLLAIPFWVSLERYHSQTYKSSQDKKPVLHRPLSLFLLPVLFNFVDIYLTYVLETTRSSLILFNTDRRIISLILSALYFLPEISPFMFVFTFFYTLVFNPLSKLYLDHILNRIKVPNKLPIISKISKLDWPMYPLLGAL